MPNEDTYATWSQLHTYVDRRLDDFRLHLDERFRAQQEAIRVLVESNQRAFDEQGRRLMWFGAGLVCIQVVLNVAFHMMK